jgi:hypothetical protein
MRCRALLCCDVGLRNAGARCREEAEPGSALCWTHNRARKNPARLQPLKLAEGLTAVKAASP